MHGDMFMQYSTTNFSFLWALPVATAVCVCVCVCARAQEIKRCRKWVDKRGGMAELLSHKCVYSARTNLTFFLKLVDGYKFALTMQTYSQLLTHGLFITEHHSISVGAVKCRNSASWQQLFCCGLIAIITCSDNTHICQAK
jgi:hypothetical protein